MREKLWTEGPWKPKCGSSVQIGNDWWFASNQTLSCVEVGKRSVTREANAALISAAPELVEALEHQCLKCKFDRDLSNAMNGADIKADCGNCVIGRALAKAYGESP